VEELRRALDVGEEEGDSACWQVRSHNAIIRPPAPRVQWRARPGEVYAACPSVRKCPLSD
jgi:hypothetical protein